MPDKNKKRITGVFIENSEKVKIGAITTKGEIDALKAIGSKDIGIKSVHSDSFVNKKSYWPQALLITIVGSLIVAFVTVFFFQPWQANNQEEIPNKKQEKQQ